MSARADNRGEETTIAPLNGRSDRSYPVQHVEFLPGYAFSEDEQYQRLARRLEFRELQFSRAMAITDCNKRRAASLVQPTLTLDSAKTIGARLSKNEDVQAMTQYLQMLEPPDLSPVTQEEMERKLSGAFRKCEDPRTLLALTDRLVRCGKLKMKPPNNSGSENEPFGRHDPEKWEEALKALNELDALREQEGTSLSPISDSQKQAMTPND